MAVPQPTRGQAAMLTVRPDRRARKAYDPLYRRYRDLAELLRKF
jgi:hypothetical protein